MIGSRLKRSFDTQKEIQVIRYFRFHIRIIHNRKFVSLSEFTYILPRLKTSLAVRSISNILCSLMDN